MPAPTEILSAYNAEWLSSLYRQYLASPDSVGEEWHETFNNLGDNLNALQREEHGASWARNGNGRGEHGTPLTAERRQALIDSMRALALVRAYRRLGHLSANLDPLGLTTKRSTADLDPESYGFSREDFNRPIFLNYTLGYEWATLREVLEQCRNLYCQAFGAEIMHILDPVERKWLLEQIEGGATSTPFPVEEKRKILKELMQSEMFEHFLSKKFIGTKRFGLDGGETLIPLIEQILTRASQNGVGEVTFGMAHRGRLNLLAHVLHKPHRALLAEFQGLSALPHRIRGGDMKYHLGTSQDRSFEGISMHLSLVANPSHLEAVNTIVLGKVRAKQQLIQDSKRQKVMGILIHGDAAFAGQGVVAETIVMSQLKGYRTGGTIHVIINNQIGFTTSPNLARSSPYCSDVAKTIAAPIFHVNGDDPEACAHAARLAVDYRQRFAKDVIIDMWCYRRFGHNEIDEPKFTQPLMYRCIENLPTTREIYTRRLKEEGAISDAECTHMEEEYTAFLEEELEASQSYKPNEADWLGGEWSGLKEGSLQTLQTQPKTGISHSHFQEIGDAITRIPQNFALHPRLQRLIGQRKEIFASGKAIDWATAEALAIGSLLCQEFPVRFSGEDCRRGTFSQRHAVFFDQKNRKPYVSLNYIRDTQAQLDIINSPLSEFGVLGYEYGYSLAMPHALVVWEAQFGDFANGAQVIIDQFIASGEAKWLRMSGLVLLLPHGYEGQGSEHSSARLERFLELCAEENMQVCNIASPANFFHALRRQLLRDYRKPLIVMAPKSLLRNPLCVSDFQDLQEGTTFQPLLQDHDAEKLAPENEIRRILLASGKITYNLLEYRREKKINDIAILSLEQLYPLPQHEIETALKHYPKAELVWVQEEPENMGAWHFLDRRLEKVLEKAGRKAQRPKCLARPCAATPATGRLSMHKEEELALMKGAFAKQ